MLNLFSLRRINNPDSMLRRITNPTQRNPILYFFLLLLSPILLNAQTGTDVITISARYLCPSYNVDERVLGGETTLAPVFDSLQHVEPNAYPLMGQWCRVQRLRCNRMANSLANDYRNDSTSVWIDSSHCIPDGVAFIQLLRSTADTLSALSSRFEQLEKERVETEQKQAAILAKAEAIRHQRELEYKLTMLKDSIKNLHRTISNTCDGDGVTDRSRLKELKDIFYAYLSVYNRYDIGDPSISEGHLSRLDELHKFQIHLNDSLLGPNALTVQLEEFKKELHLRTGKEHNDVYKSYIRVFKKINIPITFRTIAEYKVYINNIQELITVSHSYIHVVELRDSITAGTAMLNQKCARRHRDILTSYRELLSEMNSVPNYATIASSEKFIANLQGFIEMQSQYSQAIDRVDMIQKRGDSIVALCPKALSDVAQSYRSLASTTDLVPHFINASSSDRYYEILDNFEEVQRLYVDIIDIRKDIDQRATRITSDRNAPRGLVNGYRHLVKYTNFTPNFTTPRGGNDMIRSLNYFIELQEKFLTINSNNGLIENNTKQMRTAFREYGNIYKAYERILSTYRYDLDITGEAELNSYLKHQEQVMGMQSKFVDLINSLEKEEYNSRLKRVRDTEKIRLIMGL